MNALRAFEAAARLRSFARAADELAVTPTAISHQIKGLEEMLGVELFVRLPRGLRLSAAGTAYLPELTRGFDALARASDRLTGSGMTGIMKISTMGSLAQCWLVPRLIDFHRRYPDLTLVVSATTRLVDFMREDVDVAIRYGKGGYPALRTVKIMEEEVFPVASPILLERGPPLDDWPDLARHVLLHDNGTFESEPWLNWQVWLRREGVDHLVDATRGIEYDNSAMLVEAAVRGHGVALGRSVLVAEHLREGRLVPLFNTRRPADYAYFAVAPEATADQPRVQAFIAWLQEEAERDDWSDSFAATRRESAVDRP